MYPNTQISRRPILEARDLTVVRRRAPILSESSLQLHPGEFTVVIGPNGAGKSTLLKCLSGELAADQGSVQLEGRKLEDWPAETLALKRAVLAQQTPLVFPFRVHEVVALGRLPHRKQSNAGQDASVVNKALERVDLTHLRKRRYTTLSGGEQQRAQLGRILAQLDIGHSTAQDAGKQLLFLDEPISALDIRHQCRILGIARQLSENGMSVFAVLHDLNYALRFADRILLMRDGRIHYDVRSQDCHPEMLETIFEISLARIPGAGKDAPDFFFPKPPISHTQQL
jgi:iron complex transport system ATP-binding protein